MILNRKINPKEVQIFMSLKSKLPLISVGVESVLRFNRNLLVMAKLMFQISLPNKLPVHQSALLAVSAFH